MNYSKRNKVSVIVNDNLKLSYDFGGHNQYQRFLRKDISVDKAYSVHSKNYYGSFSIVYENEEEIRNLI